MNRKAVFDAVKRMLGRGYTPAEVAALDAAIDASMKPDAPSEPERNSTPSKIGPEGVALIKAFEGCARKRPDGMIEAYPDPGTGGHPWTIGWGSTKNERGEWFAPGATITQAQADWLLERQLVRYAAEVAKALGLSLAATSQAQFDALVSFHYNTGAIARATLTSKHRAGLYEEAALEFARWNRAGGRVLAGLVRRRAAEAAVYRKGSQ